MPMPEYADVILDLAKAEVVCPCDGHVGACGGTCSVCQSGECCGGMGRIPLFPTLRVKRNHWKCPQYGECSSEDRFEDCQGRGWVPEPDERVAAWEVFKSLPNRIKQEIVDLPLDDGADCWEEAVFQAGLAYAKERGYA